MATVDEVKKQVGDDADAAKKALEEERAGEGRTSLISHLEGVVSRAEGGNGDDDDADNGGGESTGPEMEEPTAPAVNPTTLGQQAEAGTFRHSMQHAGVSSTGSEAGGQGEFDIRPAITRVDGKLRQVKQIKTN